MLPHKFHKYAEDDVATAKRRGLMSPADKAAVAAALADVQVVTDSGLTIRSVVGRVITLTLNLAVAVVGGAAGLLTGTERERVQGLGAALGAVASANTALTLNTWVTVASIAIPANTKYWVVGKVDVPIPANFGATVQARIFDGTNELDRTSWVITNVAGESMTLALVLPGVPVTGAVTASLQVWVNSTGMAIDAGGGDGRTSVRGVRVN